MEAGEDVNLASTTTHRPQGQHRPMDRPPNFELVRHDVTEPISLEWIDLALPSPARRCTTSHKSDQDGQTSFLGTYNMLGLAPRVGPPC